MALAPRVARAQAPAAPMNLSANGVNTVVGLWWTKPGGTITGYEIRYSKTGTRGSASWVAIQGSDRSTVAHLVTGLENGSEYSFQVRAVNGATKGAATDWVTATPDEVCPSIQTPTNLSITPGSDRLTITWTAPADPFRGGWLLEYRETSGSWTEVTPANSATSHTLTGLESDTEYQVRLSASLSSSVPGNCFFTSSYARATATTLSTTPRTITLSATSTSTTEGNSGTKDETITATLSGPAPAGFSITVTLDPDGSGTATGSSSNCTSPLQPADADYCFPGSATVAIAEGTTKGTRTIRIIGDIRDEPNETINLVGAKSGWTTGKLTLTIEDDDDPPAAPTGLTATAGNAQVELSWTKPSGPITSYKLRYDKTGDRNSASWAAISSSGAGTVAHTVTSLENGNEYSFQIRAVNGAGDGAATGWVTATPISPTAKTITLSAPSTTIPEGDTGTTEVTVTATLGEAAPASFSLTIAPDVDPGTSTGSGCTPPLTTGADYCLPDGNVVVIAEGENQGTWTVRILGDTRDESDETIHLLGGRNGWTSGKLTLTIQDDDDASPVLLAAPTDLTATAGDAQVELSWTRPSGTITSYQIRYDKTSTRSSASWEVIQGSGAGTETHTVTGLDNESEYSFQIRAVNGAGDGTATNWLTATPTANTITPAAPTNLTATAGDAQVELSWAGPGGPITSYQIRYDKTSVRDNASWAAIPGSGAGTETHTVTSLDNGSEYSFQIRAVNDAGDGSATDWVTATPTLASGSVAQTYYIDTASGSGSVCTRSAPCTLEEAFRSKQAEEATFLIRVPRTGDKVTFATPSMSLTAAPIIFGAYVAGNDAAVEGTLSFTGTNALLIAPTAQVKLDEQVRLEFKAIQVGTASDPAREETMPIFFSGSGSEERISITGTLTVNSRSSTVDHLVVSESFTLKGGAPLLVQGELRVPGDATLTLESDLTVTDDVHLSSGAIRPYSGTMEFLGDLKLSGTGGLRTKRSGTEAERAIVIHGDFVQAKGTVTESSGVALHPGTTKTVKGDFVVRDSTARYEADSGATLTLEGDVHYAKEGKLNATLEFKGEEAQELKTGAKTELHNVEVNNSKGVLLASSVTQQNAATLTLRQGRIMNADPTVSSTWTVKNPQIEENLQGRTSALETERCGPGTDRACRFSIARGSVQSHTLVPFTRHLEHGNSGDGALSGGYLFPVGNTEERQVSYRPLILQLPSDLSEARAVTVTTMTDSEERLGTPLTVPVPSGGSLILDVHAEMFWKIETGETLESEVNLRVVGAGLRNVSKVEELRLVQWDCEWANPKLAGQYPGSIPAGSFGVNDLLNGVVNLTQERITLDTCTILGIAANSVENPINLGDLSGGRARIQFIHNLPGIPVPVDVYLGDLRIRSGLPFREATAYRTVGAAEYELTIRADGLPEDATPDPVSLTLRNQRNYVVIAHGSTEDPRMKVLETQLASSVTTKADAVFVHGAADLGAVDVRVLNPSDNLTPLMVLADNLPFDGKTSYLSLDASMHNVQVSSPNSAEEYEVFRMDLSGYGNETLVLNLSGSREDLRILGVDRNGMTFLPDVITGVETERAELPTEFALHGNYPNPFNPSTRIRFDLPETAQVRVQIVDLLGREVMSLPAQEFEAGTHRSIELNATNLASGTYLYRIIATGAERMHVKTGRMTLVK